MSDEGEELFFEGDALFDDMLARIARAQTRVWMESYIFAADATGMRFADALIEAAERGLDVRLHLDAAGILFATPDAFLDELRCAGVRVRVFHRWSWRDPWRYNRRNHCKLLLLDTEHVYLGGFNVHDDSSARVVGPLRWRDTHIRLDTPRLAEQAAELFLVFWDKRSRSAAAARRRAPDLARRDALVTNRLRRHRHALRALFRQGFARARHRVYLTTPYFAPDRRTRQRLAAAAARGVEVRLLLPGVSDVRLVQMAARFIYAGLLRAGVHIHEYGARTLHAKTVVVDGDWATIGTSNFDYRSLFHNYEINFATRREAVCGPLEAQFLDDLGNATEITLDALGRFGWRERLGGWVGWQLRRWL